jgi:membrane protein YdbS with pleckstrin-like domain
MPDIFISPDEKLHEPAPSGLPKKTPTTEAQKMALHGHSHSLLSAFSFYPDHIDFETRSNEEKIVLFLRQHIIVNVKWVLITIFLLAVPSLAKFFGVFESLPVGFELVITLACYLFTFAYALESFLGWYFNVYIVTNMWVVDVDFHNLIYKQVSDADLEKIQDVTYNMGGVARTVFNYGDVFIQTAAEVAQFEFLAVPYPDRVAKIINDLIKEEEK